MKTNFAMVTEDFIKIISTAKEYVSAKSIADTVNMAFDNERNENGKIPVIKLLDYEFPHLNKILSVCIQFDNDKSDKDDLDYLELPIIDFQKWAIYNGYAIWEDQEIGHLDWEATYQEEISETQILAYLNDICTARVAYKTVATFKVI